MKIKDKIGLMIILIGAIPVIACFLRLHMGMSSIFVKLPSLIYELLLFGNLMVSSLIMIIGAIIIFFDQNKIWLKFLGILIILFSIFWQYSMCKVEL